jgi:hypothetical protein
MWAYTNTALLIAPVILGFFSIRIWFVPNPATKVPSFAVLVVYYAAVFYICKRSSGVESIWREYSKKRHTWQQYLGTAAGLALLSVVSFAGIYITGASVLTAVIGGEVERRYIVTAFYDPHEKRCDLKLILKDISPALRNGFCVGSDYSHRRWEKDSEVVLHGKESIVGFRITGIGS